MRAASLVLCASTLAACTLFSPVEVETTKHVLSAVPRDLPQGRSRSATLLILPPDTEPMYATTQMAYSVQPFQIAYFSRNEWGETPSQMMQHLLVETLRNTRALSAVVMPPYAGRYTHVLRSRILELKHDFTSDPAMLRLAVRFELSDEAANRVIAARELSVAEPMAEKTPDAGVVAANDAAAKLLRDLAELIVEKMS